MEYSPKIMSTAIIGRPLNPFSPGDDPPTQTTPCANVIIDINWNKL